MTVADSNGEIEFFYQNMTGVLDSATIGLENSDGSDGLRLAYNSNYVQNLMAVKMTYGPLNFVAVSPLSGTTTIGNISALAVNFNAWNLPPGTYTADIQVAHTGTGISPWNIPAILDVTNPPTDITITNPSDGETLLSSQNISISVTATDDDFGIERVEFFDGVTKLGEDTTSSYYHYWNNLTAGTHELTAKAIDQFGTETTSSKVTVTVLADSDNDSMSDDWEILHFGNLDESRYDDFDNDGYTNLEEYQGGHDPKVVEDTDLDGMPDGWEEDNGLDLLVDDSGLDPDDDDLTNIQEHAEETNPHDYDSDGDYLPDGWEWSVGLEPTINDSSTPDPDGDTVDNLLEYLLGFNPLSNDSDNDTVLDSDEDRDSDGMPDAWEAETGIWKNEYNSQTGQSEYTITKALDWEVADDSLDYDEDELNNFEEYQEGTKANDYDTDSDLLPDGWEVMYGLDPLISTGDDGLDGHKDTDGLRNLDEYIHGTNPTLADSDGDGTDDDDEVNQGGDPNDAADGGNAPPPETIFDASFRIGDPSGSNSERWQMLIKGITPEVDTRQFNFVSEEFGEVDEKIFKLRQGASYEITLEHIATNQESQEPDYDWEAQVAGKPEGLGTNIPYQIFIVELSNATNTATWVVENSDGLLTTERHGDSQNITISKKSTLLPVDVAARKKDEAIPENGVLLKVGDVVEYAIDKSYFGEPKQFEDIITWEYRMLKVDGTYWPWTAYGAHGKGTSFEHTTQSGGVFQIRCVIDEAYMISYNRKKDEKNGSRPSFGPGLAGEANAVGVCTYQYQIDLCREAQKYYDSEKYEGARVVEAEYGFPVFPAGVDVMRCNIFVAHIGVAAGLNIPKVNGWLKEYPPLANQWAGVEHIVPEAPGYLPYWSAPALFAPTAVGAPEPGWIIAHPWIGDSGHVGIVDYDGEGIGASMSGTVNKNYSEFFDGTSRYRGYIVE